MLINDEITIPLGDANWFGLGALRNQRLTLEKLSIPLSPLISADPITPGLGETGFLGILEPFWFNSKGEGFYVESEQLISFSFNAPIGEVPGGMSRPYLAAEIKTDKYLKIFGKDFNLHIFKCKNAKEVVEAYYKIINKCNPPEIKYFEKPLWTTWANFKNDINHEKVLKTAEDIIKHGFTCGVFGIDAKWQKEFGDSSFDKDKFPDSKGLIKQIHDLGFEASVWNVPFFNRGSEHFEEAISKGYVLRNAEDNSPYIGRWWEGEAVFLDLTNLDALEWHFNNLKKLADITGLDGFKFDAGEAGFYLNSRIKGSAEMPPQLAGKRYMQKVSEAFPWSDARTGWRTQDAKILLRQWDKNSTWGYDNGLASCITQSINLNLLGYRYNFPDMIAGNEYGEEKVSEELMVRWIQAVAPMPFIQFSIPPWRFGKECAQLCLRYTQLHAQFSKINHEIAKSGMPIVRPLWWLSPEDEKALNCEDQYLIGDDYLVAPVIEPKKHSRDIYLPQGSWQSFWDKSEVHTGNQTLRSYDATIETLPLFQRIT